MYKSQCLLTIIILCLLFVVPVRAESIQFMFRFHTNCDVVVEEMYCDSSVSTSYVLPCPEREGYVFAGWYEDEKLTVEYDLSLPGHKQVKDLYAKWDAIPDTSQCFHIIYHINGGNFTSDYPVYFGNGETAIVPNPEREGYTFCGWFSDEALTTPVSSLSFSEATDIHLYAAWSDTEDLYKITYYTNGGTLAPYTPTYVKDGIATIIPNPTREGYVFKGWYLDESLEKKISSTGFTASGPFSLYAKWEESVISLTYVTNGGQLAAGTPTDLTEGESLVIPNPTRTGYTFKGWYLDESLTYSLTGTSTVLEGDIILYAKWELTQYIIYYHSNGGLLDSYTQLFTFDKGVSSLATPTRYGYTFKGWFLDRDFTQPITRIGAGTTNNIDVYAKWERVLNESDSSNASDGETVKVYYDLNGGTNSSLNPKAVIKGETYTLHNPTRKKHLFKGWYTDAKFTNKVTAISTSKSIKLYAKWEYMALSLKWIKIKNVKTRTLSVKYSKNKYASGYQIVYSTNKKFKKKYTKTLDLKGKKKTSKKIKKLKKGKTYYIKVRAYGYDSRGKKVYGLYTKTAKFKIWK